jgi:D-arabinose 1-dehydrogenase-like Zn-dependent alcohol dehydrogenase
MRAAVVRQFNGPLRIEELPIPEPGEVDARVVLNFRG